MVRDVVCTGNQSLDCDGWWTRTSRPWSGARAASRLLERVLTADLSSPAAVPAPEGASNPTEAPEKRNLRRRAGRNGKAASSRRRDLEGARARRCELHRTAAVVKTARLTKLPGCFASEIATRIKPRLKM